MLLVTLATGEMDTVNSTPPHPPLPLWLQTPYGELRGELRLLERHRLRFELAAPMRPGDVADFHFLLPAPGGTGGAERVRGTLRFTRIIDAHPDAPTLFSADIVSIRRQDQAALEVWLGRRQETGQRRFDAISGSETPEVEMSDTAGTDAFDPRDLPDRSNTQTGSSSPYGFTSGSRDPSLRLAGREAIRSALRRGLQARRQPGRPGGRSQRWVHHSRQLAEAQARRWLSGQQDGDATADSPAPAPAAPLISLDPTTEPPTVTVRWRSPDDFRRSWRMHLRGGGLFIAVNEPIVAHTRLQILLELPSGRRIACHAQVVAPMPTGLGLSMDLDAAQREALETEAR